MIKGTVLTTIFALVFSFSSWSQSYNRANSKKEKYFIGAGYGAGSAYWFSSFNNTELYDKNGSVLKSGAVDFRAKNSTRIKDFNVLFPIGPMRMGMGIGFEEFYLDKLDIGPSSDSKIVLFDETFRFDKIYLQAEYQLFQNKQSPAALCLHTSIGYFGYNGIDRINFFGDEALAKKYFFTIGIVGEYRMFQHTYAFLMPMAEYKLFRNSESEQPASIKHNIVSMAVIVGLRFDISRD